MISWHRTLATTINLGRSLFIGLVPLCLVAKAALVGVPSVKRLRAPRPHKPSHHHHHVPPLSVTPVIPHYRFARWWKPNDPRARVYRPPFFDSGSLPSLPSGIEAPTFTHRFYYRYYRPRYFTSENNRCAAQGRNIIGGFATDGEGKGVCIARSRSSSLSAGPLICDSFAKKV